MFDFLLNTGIFIWCVYGVLKICETDTVGGLIYEGCQRAIKFLDEIEGKE
jgi:hypothetical protein